MEKRCRIPAILGPSHAQISMEYLLVMSFALLITIPIIISFFANASATNEQVSGSQARQAARKIIDSAESVYYLGEPSSTTLKVYVPERTESITVATREINFRLKTAAGYSDIAVLSAVNLTGNLSQGTGIRIIQLQAQGDTVVISSP